MSERKNSLFFPYRLFGLKICIAQNRLQLKNKINQFTENKKHKHKILFLRKNKSKIFLLNTKKIIILGIFFNL